MKIELIAKTVRYGCVVVLSVWFSVSFASHEVCVCVCDTHERRTRKIIVVDKTMAYLLSSKNLDYVFFLSFFSLLNIFMLTPLTSLTTIRTVEAISK